MNRRGFLGRLAAIIGTVAAAPLLAQVELDPERALWVPGKKTFFLPPTERFVVASAGRLDALDAQMQAQYGRSLRTAQEYWYKDAQSYAKRGLLCDDMIVTRWSHEIGGYVTEQNRVENGIVTGIDVQPLHPGQAPVQGKREWPTREDIVPRALFSKYGRDYRHNPGPVVLTDRKE